MVETPAENAIKKRSSAPLFRIHTALGTGLPEIWFADKRLRLLSNFHVPLIEDGIPRVVTPNGPSRQGRP